MLLQGSLVAWNARAALGRGAVVDGARNGRVAVAGEGCESLQMVLWPREGRRFQTIWSFGPSVDARPLYVSVLWYMLGAKTRDESRVLPGSLVSDKRERYAQNA